MNKNDKWQKKWVGAVTLILIAFTVGVWVRRCPNKVFVSLGELPSMEAGNRASIQQLSAAVCRCPKAKRYEVFWKASWKAKSEGKERGRRSTIYDRRRKEIGYEDDPGSGFSSDTYIADDAAIHAIAQQTGVLEDFGALPIAEHREQHYRQLREEHSRQLREHERWHRKQHSRYSREQDSSTSGNCVHDTGKQIAVRKSEKR